MRNLERMKQSIAANRKSKGEPPAQPLKSSLPIGKHMGDTPKSAPAKVEVEKGRWPHQTHIHVEYDAAKELWTGTVQIPNAEPRYVDTASGSAVHGLLRHLYRRWLTAGRPGS